MTHKQYLVLAAGAIIGILVVVVLTVALGTKDLTGSVAFEQSVDDTVSNCVGLRIQCKNCLYRPYNWAGRQMCASLCERYFDKCYERRLPVTPFVRG